MYEYYYGDAEWKVVAPELIKKISYACIHDLITPSEFKDILMDPEYDFLLSKEFDISEEYPETRAFYLFVHMLDAFEGAGKSITFSMAKELCEVYEKFCSNYGKDCV
jgi:hypothetical protein